jgi:hypothetical protein
MLAAIALIRLVIIALLLVFLAPITEKHSGDENRGRGNMRVEITWQTGKDVDVDLWVQAPGDKPVGWSNKSGKVFDLVRDDLGNVNNPLGVHYEVSYARGLPAGEYIVNVHLYNNRERSYKIVPVNVMITLTKDDTGKGAQQKLWTGKINLTQIGQEVTALRFKVDNERNVVPGSLNTVPYKLFTRPK